MNKTVKIVIAAAVLAAGLIGFSKISAQLNKDPEISGIQAEFIGEVAPGQALSKRMFSVKGVTDAGKLVELNDFSSETGYAASNGSSCEIEIESQGYKTTVIVNITRTPELEKNIGYPNEEDAKVTYYSNGDLEFTGKGDITNFNSLPWTEYKYSHVYIYETLNIESMDGWFQDNEILIYCSNHQDFQLLQ